MHRAPEVHSHDGLIVGEAHRALGPDFDDAGVVHHDVEAAVARHDRVDQALGGGRNAQVAGDGEHLTPVRGEVFGRSLQLALVPCANGDAGALAEELARENEAQAARTSGDEHDASAQAASRQQAAGDQRSTGSRESDGKRLAHRSLLDEQGPTGAAPRQPVRPRVSLGRSAGGQVRRADAPLPLPRKCDQHVLAGDFDDLAIAVAAVLYLVTG